jgi:anti-sigma regulatory factor (Ser/Thr protein kinase)
MTTTGQFDGGLRAGRTPDGWGAPSRPQGASRAAEFTPDAASPRHARAFVADVLRDAGVDESVVECARLLVSELVTNALLHARSSATVTVEVRHGRVRVSVADASPVLPSPQTPDPSRSTGRGLLCLDRLALRWAAEPTARGKVVWFDLRAETSGQDRTEASERDRA